ncbi:MAG: aldehyde dehydrogenase family protein, partial [Pseudolabrys sp.]
MTTRAGRTKFPAFSSGSVGKSPQILFADGDIDAALEIIAGGAFLHCGQVCNAGTRLLVERKIHDR